MITAEVNVTGGKELLDACFVALEPEQEFKSERAKYSLKKTDKKLIITVEANDLSAFRAVMNSINSLLAIVNQNWRLKNDI